MCACVVIAGSVVAITFRDLHSLHRADVLPVLRFLVRGAAALCGSVCVMIAYDAIRDAIAGIPSAGANADEVRFNPHSERVDAAAWGLVIGSIACGFFYVTSKLDSILRSISGAVS